LWKAAGVEFAALAKEFQTNQIAPQDAQNWLKAGISNIEQIAAWRDIGQDPSVAVLWIRRGLQASDFTRYSGSLPTRPVLPLQHQPRGGGTFRAPTPAHSSPKNPRQLAPIESTVSQSRSTRDQKVASFEEWIRDGRAHIEAVGGATSVGQDFLKALFVRGFRWSSAFSLHGIQPTDEWLMEIQLRADLLRNRLRISISESAYFEGIDLQILLSINANRAFAWVGMSGQGTLTAFALPGCRPLTPLRTPLQIASAGVAIAWFLDLSVSLRSPGGASRQHPHFTVSSKTTHSQKTLIRYVPTPNFESHQRSVASKQFQLMPTHKVEGHVRTLPEGWTPSEEARDNAPAYMKLRANETFVRSHLRGTEIAASDLERRLSKYSALAEALGMSGW
jgi:hypothetical protein